MNQPNLKTKAVARGMLTTARIRFVLRSESGGNRPHADVYAYSQYIATAINELMGIAVEMHVRNNDQPSDISDVTEGLSVIDAIQQYIDDVNAGYEFTPDEIGKTPGIRRRTIINSALALALAKASRRCDRNSTYVGAILYYVSIRSDNDHGRCTDSAKRISDYVGCAEDVFRDLRDALILCNALRGETCPDATGNSTKRRSGKSVPIWLPYVNQAVVHSDFAILTALAPPRPGPGRPRKTSGANRPNISAKTSGAIDPTNSQNDRVFRRETSGIPVENVGHLTPDNRLSVQTLNTDSENRSHRFRSRQYGRSIYESARLAWGTP